MIYSQKKIIAANWKMNKTTRECTEFAHKLIQDMPKNSACKVIIFPTAVSLENIGNLCKNSDVIIGSQNCHWESFGAFTGEISAEMVKSAGAQYVLVGHSERRNYFAENDVIINKKVKKVVDSGLSAMLCVGENLEQRLSGRANATVERQIKCGLSGIKFEDFGDIVIAYEPVWAIGTGKAVEPSEADKMGEFIKNIILEAFGAKISVLYGGSVSPSNARKFLSLKNIDGALIGGAALDETKFAEIIQIASEVR